MKLLVVCQYYYPENFQITPICERLVLDGYDVTVLTGLPNYPIGIVPDEYKKGHREEIINGVHILRCNEIGRKTGAVYLTLNYLSYMISALCRTRYLPNDYDVVMVYQLSPVLMAIPGKKYAAKNKVPMIIYCCDLWPESMKMYIHNEKNILFKFMKSVSTRIYQSAQCVIGQSSSFLPYLKKVHNIEDRKLSYIPAFADETYLTQDFTPSDENNVDFMFLGNLGIAQDLMAVLEAVYKIKNIPGFKVHFVGDGSMLATMRDYVSNHNLEKIVAFYGRRPVNEMPDYYRIADVCLVSLKADNQIGLTLPTKVQGYMAAGKPILGMIDGSAKDVIDESERGICVHAGDVDGLADAMKQFITNKQKFINCGQNARRYFVENFSIDKCIKKLEYEIEKVVK